MASSTLNTVYDCFDAKSDYTKQALRELNNQMKTFDFAKSCKKSKVVFEDDSTKVFEEYFISDDDSTEDRTYQPPEGKRQPRRQNKRPRTSNKTAEDTNMLNLIGSLQRRVENMKQVIDIQSRRIDKLDVDLYQRKLELSNKAVELEDSNIEHAKFVTEHNQMIVKHKSEITTYRIYFFGTFIVYILMLINTLKYLSS
jgi:hypothetical protein